VNVRRSLTGEFTLLSDSMGQVPSLYKYERLSVNGVNLGVVQYGEKWSSRATLVLLHGFTGSAIAWEDISIDLASLGLHVVALDMLGHGQSDAPADAGRYSMEHCQKDILAALQILGVERGEAILLGYSMGGRIALYCAFAGYFRALILESASPGLATSVERQQRRASDEALATRIERDGVEAFIDYWRKIPLFASQQQLAVEQREELHAQRLTNRAQGLANSLRGVGTGVQPELYTSLPTLNLPVLLLAGELDSKFCTIAQQMASQLPQARLQIIPGAGHTIHLEQPEAFVTCVGEFCAIVLR
jgi:2-succinyl-6-hydroxy-2,4-cyclohexadiene-1-carboxylate synthase